MINLVRFSFLAFILFSAPQAWADSNAARELAERLEAKAMNGDIRATYKLGLLFSQGKKVQVDYVTAFEWFLRAAKHDDVKAMMKVSDMYLAGKGIDPSVEEATKWNEKAAKKGSRKAMVKLGAMAVSQKKYADSAYWYKKAAVMGDVTAMREIARYYYNGTGVHFNLTLAFAWYELAVKRKDRSARTLQLKMIEEKGQDWANEIRSLVENRMIPKEYWDER
ncbi:exported hypothetical protein [Candidatus Terasakiella magnetica]|uniref:Sel1 repeat family protein n=1 Tax=Candidatus Terasakiella magnetica TaxID=1867952 RepID=A0A1C3REI1_9PROT|nr:tetratricopeptide repeat protein [Candidatus Terasakiella magnetica]SCA55634.1 exported hypothetical protein [Candidatus Terasakiella magnetica]